MKPQANAEISGETPKGGFTLLSMKPSLLLIVFNSFKMSQKIFYKLFLALFPQSLMLTGSLLLSFALKLVDTKNLWEQEGVVNGGVSIRDVGMNIPVQNDTLFWWGFILFLIGSALEFIRITHNTIVAAKGEEASKPTKEMLPESKKFTKVSKKA